MGILAEPESCEANGAAVRLLFVEDLPELRRAFARMLRTLGYVVVEAEDGQAALKLLDEQTFDLVLTDVMMPRMNGLELLRTLQEQQPDLPVLVMSAVPSSQIARQAAESGAFEYLAKPVEPELLRRSVQRALAARSEARAVAWRAHSDNDSLARRRA